MPLRKLFAERGGAERFFEQAEDSSFGFAQQDVAAHRGRTGDERQPGAVALFGDFNIIRELWRPELDIVAGYATDDDEDSVYKGDSLMPPVGSKAMA